MERLFRRVWKALRPKHLYPVRRTAPHVRLLRDFKKFTSKRLAEAIINEPESRRDWLLDKFNFEARKTRRAEHFKILRDDNHAIDMTGIGPMKKLFYIHDNQVRTMIVENQEDCLFSSARDYARIKDLVEIELF